MKHRYQNVALPLVISLGLLCACSSQVEPIYQGEPLATLKGQVINALPNQVEAAEAALLYFGGATPIARSAETIESVRALSVAESVPVDGVFPAKFNMNIFAPPPAIAYDAAFTLPHGDGSTELVPNITATALIVALRPGTDKRNVRPADVLGVSLDHFLIYFERGQEPDSHLLLEDPHLDKPLAVAATRSAGFMVPLSKGYQLAKINEVSPEQKRAYYTQLNKGLCVRTESDNRPTPDPERDFITEDIHYKHCIDFSTIPIQSCTIYNLNAPSAEQLAETQRCTALRKEIQGEPDDGLVAGPTDGEGLLVPKTYIQNPEGLLSPVTITLGATVQNYYEHLFSAF